ncbi:MAG: nitronate monooxygenase [Solirubrobacteraceae bacterium]|jgi:nitronate monooxygenase|nr:nitronate monooxygenase [Solirubrobacteraceae bacterium]
MMIDTDVPVVLAPMAGGPSTPALANAVIGAGGVGSLGFGYLSAEAAEAQLREVADGPLLVNLFVPGPPSAADTGPYVARLRAAGLEVDDPQYTDDAWDAKLEIVCAAAPAAVSFTFGCPPREVLARVQAAGSQAWVTVTSAAEAREAAAAGADALVVQGAEAGGHRGSFVDGAEATGTLALLQLVRAAVDVPLVAAGGIATAGGVRAVLDAGATLAAAGTAFMLAPEAGTPAPLRAAVGTDRPTALTRAFTGRLARGIVNEFMERFGEDAPSAYPEINSVTSALRKRARAAGDESVVNLWAGQAHALTVERPAAETVAALAG